MATVSLVQMPYVSLVRPSIALGLLKSYLEQKNIKARVWYCNLTFAEEIGPHLSATLENMSADNLLGEWTFAGAAFPDFTSDEDQFLQLNHEFFNGQLAKTLERMFPDLDMKERIRSIREYAREFVIRTAHEILETGPRIVGCSSMFQQHCASLALLRQIKLLDPSVITMMGGANCVGDMGRRLHQCFDWVDFVALGEADGYFGHFCRDLIDKGAELSPEEIPPGVMGPAHRMPSSRKSAQLERTPNGSAFMSMDDLATPDYDDYFETLEEMDYAGYVTPALPVETSRGCWWGMKHHCTFCGLNGEGMVFRKKSPEHVLSEWGILARRYQIPRLMLVDNIIATDAFKTWLPQVADATDSATLFAQIKPILKREQLECLASAGVRWILPGLESMHATLLRNMNKGNTPLTNVQLLKWSQELGLRVLWTILYRFPGDDDACFAEMAEWMPLLFHLPPPRSCGRIQYERFSLYHKKPGDFGLRLSPNRFYPYVFPLSEEELTDFAFYFEDEAEDGLKGVDEHGPGFTALYAVVKEWNRVYWADSEGVDRPELTIFDYGDHSILKDTRPVAVHRDYRLEGLEHQVIILCEVPRSLEFLAKKCRSKDGELESVIDLLVRQKLLLQQEGKYTSLAVRPIVQPLHTRHDAPIGYFDFGRYLAALGQECLEPAPG